MTIPIPLTPEERFAAAVDTQEKILARVEVVVAKSRRQDWMLVVLAVLVAVSVGLAVAGWRLSHDFREDARADERARTAQMLDNCRTRNGGFLAVRQFGSRQADVVDRLTPDTPDGNAVVAELRAAIPPAEQTDLDCNGDGGLDVVDYPVSASGP